VLSKHHKFDIASLCEEVHPEDGINPLFTKHKHHKNLNHKIKRYCRQIHHALDLVLLSCSNELLSDIYIHTVEENLHNSTLTVLCGIASTATEQEIEEKYVVLNQLIGRFRREIARTINRKRTPDLKIQIINIEGGWSL
jgi:ribosome-binding factor A